MRKVARKSNMIDATCTKEWQIQAALVNWCRMLSILIISIPNGAKRSFAMSMREKSTGLTAGASDLFMPIANRKYHGYFIELKRPGEKPRGNQYVFMEKVRTQGYKAEYFDDWIKAKESIEEYLRDVYTPP